MITQKELKSRFFYDEETGVFTWKPGHRAMAGNEVQPNSFDKDGYKLIGITVEKKRKTFRAHKLAWLYIYGKYPDFELDHIDRNILNNRGINLRKLDNQHNQRNTENWKTNTSGVKGVGRCKNGNLYRWRATIRNGDKNQKFLGVFENFDDAVCVRLAAEQCLDFDKCYKNSPAFQYVKNNINGDIK